MGAAFGVLFGGILVEFLSWPWIFFVNVPVGIAALILSPFLLSESLDKHGQGFDALGAILVTTGLSTFVLGHHAGSRVGLELGDDHRSLRHSRDPPRWRSWSGSSE